MLLESIAGIIEISMRYYQSVKKILDKPTIPIQETTTLAPVTKALELPPFKSSTEWYLNKEAAT